jgi:hypothetical protein
MNVHIVQNSNAGAKLLFTITADAEYAIIKTMQSSMPIHALLWSLISGHKE